MINEKNKTVLVVNDSFELRETMQGIFRQAGYRVLIAPDEREGFELARNTPVDLVIIDAETPGVVEFRRLIRADEKLRALPILLVGERGKQIGGIAGELETGADDYIGTPIDPLRLIAGVERLIERRRTEEMLRESEKHFRSVIDNVSDVISIILPDGTILYQSPSLEQILGFKPEQVVGKNILDLIHRDDKPRVVDFFKNNLRHAAATAPIEYRFRHSGGEWVTLESTGKFIDDPAKGLIALINSRDVTGRRRLEDIVRESEERYRMFVAQSSEAIWRFEIEPPCPVDISEDEQIEWLYRCGSLAECNDAMARMHGFESAAAIAGARVGDLMPRSEPVNVEYLLKFVRSGYNLADADTFEIDGDGNPRIFSNSLSGIVENNRVMRVWGVQRDVSAQRRTETGLRRSEANLAAAQRITRLGSWEVDLSDLRRVNNNKVHWSDEVYRIFGREPGRFDISIDGYFDAIHKDDRKHCRRAFVEAVTNRKELNIEFRICLPAGGERILHGLAEVVRDERTNAPLKFIGTVQDITERKIAETISAASESRLRTQNKVLTELTGRRSLFQSPLEEAVGEILEITARALETARVGVWLYADDKKKVRTFDLYEADSDRHSAGFEARETDFPFYFEALAENPAVVDEEAPGDARTREFAASHPASSGIASLLDAPIRSGGETIGVLCCEHVGDTRRWMLDERNFAGSMAALISLLFEASERRQAENALRASQRQYESLVHSIDGIVWEMDARTFEINFISRQAERLLGYKPAQLTDTANLWASNLHEDDRARVVESLVEAIEKKRETEFDYRMTTADGRVLWLRTLVSVDVVDGEAKRLRGIAVDITDRRHAEESLKQSERDYRAVFEQAHDAIIIFAPEHEIVLDVNCRATELYGFSRSEFIGMSVGSISKNPAGGREKVRETLEVGEYLNFETVQYRRDGSEMFLEVNASTIIYRGRRAIISINRDVTERSRAESALRASEERYRFLGNAVPQQVWTAQTDGRLDYGNERTIEYFGKKSEEELLGMEWLGVLHPDDIETCNERWSAALAAGEPYENEFRLRREDGEYRWHLAQAVPMRDPATGDVIKWFGTNTDIHERKLADEALRASLSLLTSTFEATADGIAVFDSRFNLINCNNKFLEMWGVSEEAIKGRSNADTMPLVLGQMLDPAQFVQRTERLQSNIDASDCDTIEFKDGRIYERYVQPQIMENVVVGQVLSFRDISERRRVEEEKARLTAQIESQRRRLDTIIANVPGVVWESHFGVADRREVNFVSDHVQTMTGYSVEEWLSESDFWLRIIHPDDKAEAERNSREASARSGSVTQQYRWIRKDGEFIWVETQMVILSDETGKPFGIRGVTIDTTARKNAETAIAEANEGAIREYERLIDRVAQLAESLGTARDLQTIYRALYSFSVVSVPCTGFFISLYDVERGLRLPGYAVSDGDEIDIALLPPMEIGGSPNSRAVTTGAIVIEDDFQAAMTGQPIINIGLDKNPGLPQSCLIAPMAVMGRVVGTVEAQAYTRAAYTKEHASAMRMAANLAANAIENVRLLEQERVREEQLRQSQKLESVGRLAGGIAHDFNNMLTAINGYSDLTLRRLKTDDPLRGNIEEIKKAGERSAALTHQLLAFSRQQVLQSSVINLNEIISDTIQMLERLIGENIRLATALDAKLGCVKADAGQLGQILINLAVNARDAMPGGGSLTIETANVFLDEEYAAQHISAKSGAYILLAVSDTGIGIESDIQEHIFEPFFTTKEIGRGTGLGLATVYGIVKQSGGYIWMYSEIGLGTSFKIYLPRIDSDGAEAANAPVKNAPRGLETILIVEDEDIVRALTRRILEESGYKVIEASNGVEALSICRSRNCNIDLLMTDVVMPQMGGRELAEKLAVDQPYLRVLFTSGYTDDTVIRNNVLETDVDFIQKPFTFDALAQKIRESLDKRERQ